jgi:hypothetical protein
LEVTSKSDAPMLFAIVDSPFVWGELFVEKITGSARACPLAMELAAMVSAAHSLLAVIFLSQSIRFVCVSLKSNNASHNRRASRMPLN